MHDDMQYDSIQGQGHKPLGAGNWPLILKLMHISKFVQARFFIFGLVFVSRDFELDRNVSCVELTVSPARG